MEPATSRVEDVPEHRAVEVLAPLTAPQQVSELAGEHVAPLKCEAGVAAQQAIEEPDALGTARQKAGQEPQDRDDVGALTRAEGLRDAASDEYPQRPLDAIRRELAPVVLKRDLLLVEAEQARHQVKALCLLVLVEIEDLVILPVAVAVEVLVP